jgi:predicted lipoprotein with Yx(FWY)xxD motif
VALFNRTNRDTGTNMKQLKYIAPGLLLGLATLAAQSQPVFQQAVLTDAAGRTVYTFDKDTAGKSNCSGGCLTVWPAFAAKAGAKAEGDFGVIEAGGARQWSFKGKPLYYYASDAKAGDQLGDGMGGVWHVVPRN